MFTLMTILVCYVCKICNLLVKLLHEVEGLLKKLYKEPYEG